MLGAGGSAGATVTPSLVAAVSRGRTMTAMPPNAWIRPVVLEGEGVRLEPLGRQHLDDLAEVAFDEPLWRYTLARPVDPASLGAWLDAALANAEAGSEMPFATVDRSTGKAIGSTRFLAIVPEHLRAEIGWTWVATAYQRTGANREAKRLQLEHAFETLGANRIEFKTDSLNEKSRTALAALGATFEGIFRNHMIMPDGRLRHSAYFSVTREDWPAVKARLTTPRD